MYTLADSVLLVKEPGGCADLTQNSYLSEKERKIVPVIQQCSPF